MLKRFNIKNASLILVLVLALALLSIDINKPFIGHHDFTNVFDGIIARNYLEHGVWNLKFGQSMALAKTVPTVSSFYTHYPPLLTLMIAASFYLFGIREWAERLVPLIFSLIGVVNFYLITKRIWNEKTAVVAALFYILNPMFIYFGNMAVPDPVILGVSMLAINLYLICLDNFKRKYFYTLIATLFFGGLIGWSIDVLGPIFIVHSFLVKKFRKEILIYPLVLGITLLLQLFHTYLLTGDFLGGGIKQTFLMRFAASDLNFGGNQFTIFSYLKLESSLIFAYFSKTLVSLTAIYWLFNFKTKKGKGLLIILLVNGLFFPVLFSRYVFIHDFLNIYLMPFFALSGALGLLFIIQKFIKFKLAYLLIITVVVLIFSLERIKFTQALIKSNMNLAGLEMATVINNLNPKGQVVIISPRFKSFFGVFSNFYSKSPYSIIDEEGLKKNLNKYQYVITIDEDIKDRNFYNELKNKYKFQKSMDLTIFYINE